MTNISIDNIRKNVTTSLGINDYELDFNLVKHAVHLHDKFAEDNLVKLPKVNFYHFSN
jgi:hypothetical protein